MTATDLLDDARAALAEAPREGLGQFRAGRKVLGLTRASRIVPAGRAWHLGVLLLGDDALLATGDVVRARQDAPRGFTAESQRTRAEWAAAARRGGFAEGEVVHIGWRMLDIEAVAQGAASDPLAMQDGILSVRWSAAGGYIPLDAYLRERIAFLLDPPAGA